MEIVVDQHTQKLLQFLSDGQWHYEPPKEVRANAVNKCHREGFLRLKRVILKREGPLETYRIAMRITAEGKKELESPYRVLRRGKIIRSAVPGRYAGWRPGKIFGRLDCKQGMRMRKENRVFFLTWNDAVRAGYRPCMKCKQPLKINTQRRNKLRLF